MLGLDETSSEASAMPATPATIEPETHDTIESWRADTPSKRRHVAVGGGRADREAGRGVAEERVDGCGEDEDQRDHAEALPAGVDAADAERRSSREDRMPIADDQVVGTEPLLRQRGEPEAERQASRGSS